MSWWIRRHSKEGRSDVWAIDIDPLLVFMLLGLFSGIIYQAIYANPNILWLAPFGCMAVGVCMIAVAKAPNYRKGIITSWGTSGMTDRNARLYRTGYGLILVGVVMALVLRMKA
jgi:hypothetical protein